MTFDDDTSVEFTAPKGNKGVGVKSVALARTEDNGDKTYTMTFDDGTSVEFTAPKGDRGDIPERVDDLVSSAIAEWSGTLWGTIYGNIVLGELIESESFEDPQYSYMHLIKEYSNIAMQDGLDVILRDTYEHEYPGRIEKLTDGRFALLTEEVLEIIDGDEHEITYSITCTGFTYPTMFAEEANRATTASLVTGKRMFSGRDSSVEGKFKIGGLYLVEVHSLLVDDMNYDYNVSSHVFRLSGFSNVYLFPLINGERLKITANLDTRNEDGTVSVLNISIIDQDGYETQSFHTLLKIIEIGYLG
jgi:hypothetical protein